MEKIPKYKLLYIHMCMAWTLDGQVFLYSMSTYLFSINFIYRIQLLNFQIVPVYPCSHWARDETSRIQCDAHGFLRTGSKSVGG